MPDTVSTTADWIMVPTVWEGSRCEQSIYACASEQIQADTEDMLGYHILVMTLSTLVRYDGQY